MNNTNDNITNRAITEEGGIDVPGHKTVNPAMNSSTPKTNQDAEIKPKEKPSFNNDLPPKKEIEEDENATQDEVPSDDSINLEQTEQKKKEFLLNDDSPVVNEAELPIVSEVELPHQRDPIRPEDIVEIEQESPEEIITTEDIEKAKEIEVSPVNLLEPKPVKKLEPLTPVKKKKILPVNMSSSEVVSSLKDLRSRLNELLLKANESRITHSEKNLDRIMEYAWETQKVTNNDVERITGVKHAQATRLLKKLVKDGKLARFGRYKYTFYKPIKK